VGPGEEFLPAQAQRALLSSTGCCYTLLMDCAADGCAFLDPEGLRRSCIERQGGWAYAATMAGTVGGAWLFARLGMKTARWAFSIAGAMQLELTALPFWR